MWLLDALTRAGYCAVLIEKHALGQGQTVCAQGIIHSGLKYTLRGSMTASASAIRDMPGLWRRCLTGDTQPDLSATRVRSDFCYLWRTQSITSKLGMVGARAGLKVKPIRLPPGELPDVLTDCPGGVFRLDEQVIAPETMLQTLLDRHRQRIIQASEVDFELQDGRVAALTLQGVRVVPEHVVLSAGAGNAALRQAIGLSNPCMQKRPLHMVMMRGELPMLQGHCVDGAKTRATITSDHDAQGRVVWQVGGQIAEDGVAMSPDVFLPYAKREVQTVLPGLNLNAIQWASYRVDRAEYASPSGKRPENHSVIVEGNVITAWPTKLAMAPVLADDIVSRLGPPQAEDNLGKLADKLADLPRPVVADPPWETPQQWTSDL